MLGSDDLFNNNVVIGYKKEIIKFEKSMVLFPENKTVNKISSQMVK